MLSDLVARDLRHVWHPCSQMKDYEMHPPLEVVGARGVEIYLRDGRRLIDAISSWWCKSLGHQHPCLKQALMRQMNRFEHVILAHTTNDTIVALSEALARLTSTLSKVFYASDGSCAIEIAMKMSVHARQIAGQSQRNQFVALQNSYHGETIGALSVSDVGLYRVPYQTMLFPTRFLAPLPYVQGKEDPLWQDCSSYWALIEKELEQDSERITAVLVEPIVQGAGGMKIYSQDFLRRLRAWTKAHDVHLIADEVMTGLGRTGQMLACQHAGIEPDFLCLSKGLTSGWLPLSVVLTRDDLYEWFYAEDVGQAFLHSHTYSGNALAASVALEVLNLFEQNPICQRADEIGTLMHALLLDVAQRTQKLQHVRRMGAMVAADLIHSHSDHRLGFAVSQHAMALGALLRPLGNTIYWMPPLVISEEKLLQLQQVTEKAICLAIK